MSVELAFLSKAPGISGTIKNEPDDFIVEEIASDGTVLELDKTIEKKDEEGRFVHFVLQKKDWSTSYAVKEIARRLHAGPKRFSYAGMKDKQAVTAQLVSAQGFKKEEILGIRIKDIKINGAWNAKERVKLGALLGNRFTIRVRDAAEDADGAVHHIFEELGGLVPNYFGVQRFGTTSQNTHIIGEHIIRGEFESAAMAFLCDHENEQHQEARLARQDLFKTQDFKTALLNFPKHLRFERSMLTYLATNPKDFVGAFNQLPRQILLLFIHAFQSHLFNQVLSDRISEGKVEMEEGEFLCPTERIIRSVDHGTERRSIGPVNSFGFPVPDKMDLDGFLCIKLIGYNSNPNQRENRLLKELDIKKEQFRIKKIPEISSKGTFRTAFAPLVGFSFKDDTFRFSLQSGAYATTALREFLEVNKL